MVLEISKAAGFYHKAFEAVDWLYAALCKCCLKGDSEKYKPMLKQTREMAMEYSRLQQGLIDPEAHRIEEGEYGFSGHEKLAPII